MVTGNIYYIPQQSEALREGRQRNAANWGYSSLPAPKFERGYTFHSLPRHSGEQLDGFDLVNMNGRMYDPMLGRMLSPDPVVQAPGNLQNYNRYSYVLNNPLKYTDPTGYQVNRPAFDAFGYPSNDGSRNGSDDVHSGNGGGGSGWYNTYRNAVLDGYTNGMSNFLDEYYRQIYSSNFDGTFHFFTNYNYVDKNKTIMVTSTKHEIKVAQFGGDPTKTNFYDSNKNLLVSYPSEDNRAVVIPSNRKKYAYNAIQEYNSGELSSSQLYNTLNLHGVEYNLYINSNGNAYISKPKDFLYWYHTIGYVLSSRQRYKGQTYSIPYPDLESVGWYEYQPNPVDW